MLKKIKTYTTDTTFDARQGLHSHSSRGLTDTHLSVFPETHDKQNKRIRGRVRFLFFYDFGFK